jgi:hypothetical protein
VVVPAKDLGGLPDRICAAMDALLDRLGVDDAVRGREVAAMREVRVAPTDDASVRASMNWLAVHADTLLWDLPYRPGRTLADVNVALSEYPCGALGGGAPAAAALALLRDDVSPAAAAGRARRRR